jgi:hypothetical protein
MFFQGLAVEVVFVLGGDGCRYLGGKKKVVDGTVLAVAIALGKVDPMVLVIQKQCIMGM